MIQRPRPHHQPPLSLRQPNLLQIKKMAIMKQAFPVSNPLLCERERGKRGVGREGGREKNLQQ